MSQDDTTTTTGTVARIDRMEQFHTSMRERAALEAQNRPASLGEEITARNAEAIFAAAEKDLEGAELDAAIWDAGTGTAIQGRDTFPKDGGSGLEVQINSYRPDVSTRTFDSDSDVDNQKGYYITADAVCLGGPQEVLRRLALNVGDDFALQTGAMDVILRLRAFELRNRFPVRGVLVGVKTGKDNFVLKLKPLPTRTIQG